MLHRSRSHALVPVARRLLTLAVGATLALGLAGAQTGASAVAAAPSAVALHVAGTGVLDGDVLDGSAGGRPIAGQLVTLTRTAGATTASVATATSDAQGRFEFAGLATDPSDIYVVTAQVQGVVYSTDPISLADNAHGQITLLAYETTAVASKLGFSLVTYQLAQTAADVLAGTIHITELVNVVNGDTRTFVGTPGPAANGQPMNLLRFALPDGAADLAAHDGFAQGQLFQVDRGFATTAPVPPGQTRFSFSYDAPYSGTRFALSYRAIYPTSQVLVVVPTTMRVTAPGFTSLGTVSSGSQPVAVWQATTIFPGNAVGLAVAQLPVPGQHDQLDLPLLDLLAGLLALVAFGAVAYALWARRGGTVLGAARPGATAAVAGSGPELGQAPTALLKALARLDRAYEGGKLEDEAYRVQRAALKARLRERLLEDAGTPNGATPRQAAPAASKPGGTR